MMYEGAGLKRPPIVWCSSPFAMALTMVCVPSVGASVRASVGDSVGASVWDSVGASVGASVWDSVGDSVRASVGASVWDSVRASVWDSVGASVGASVRASVWASGWGQHEAPWLGIYDFFREVCGLVAQTDKLEGLTELAKSAGWILPYDNICWVSERHSEVHTDEAKRVHCESGPAILYPDDWAIYAWHGVLVPKEWIEDRASVSAEIALKQENVELRRAACEIVGWERILQDLGAITIDRDPDPEIGELIEVNLPDAPNERFLRVLCGTGRRFAIPVPNEMQTALQANAWSYDIPANLLMRKENRT